MLLFANAILEYNYTDKACFDVDGNVIEQDNPLGSVRCSYQVTRNNRNTIVVDGRAMLTEYTIMVDANSVESTFNPTSVRLITDNEVSKEYSVKRIEHYPLTKSYCIWV